MTFKRGDLVRVTAEWSNFFGEEGVVSEILDGIAMNNQVIMPFEDYDGTTYYDDVIFNDGELELVTDV